DREAGVAPGGDYGVVAAEADVQEAAQEHAVGDERHAASAPAYAFGQAVHRALDAIEEHVDALAVGRHIGQFGERRAGLFVGLAGEVAGIALAVQRVVGNRRAGVRGEDFGGHLRAAEIARVNVVERDAAGDAARDARDLVD